MSANLLVVYFYTSGFYKKNLVHGYQYLKTRGHKCQKTKNQMVQI
jgi:hypothetical protein